MTLPFNDDTHPKGMRKWQCFVCGMEYKSYDMFREHIVEAHEEGREFIFCPKCEAPVRDLKMHYKFKHVGWTIPPGCQHKATVWSDFTAKGKKTKPTAKFRDGTFVSVKMNGKELHYRSGYECEVYEILEQLPDVVHYDAEPLEIPYMHQGKGRKYRPDLSILFSDGRKEIWEIKPASQTSLPINDSKWTHANAYCQERGWTFMVLTEVGMGKLRRQVNTLKRTSPVVQEEPKPQSNENWKVVSPDEFQEWLDGQEE